MKFGKHILAQSHPPWKEFYLAYRKLKLILKHGNLEDPGLATEFFTALDEELCKVNQFTFSKVWFC